VKKIINALISSSSLQLQASKNSTGRFACAFSRRHAMLEMERCDHPSSMVILSPPQAEEPKALFLNSMTSAAWNDRLGLSAELKFAV
jgi:hypothetical protein